MKQSVIALQWINGSVGQLPRRKFRFIILFVVDRTTALAEHSTESRVHFREGEHDEEEPNNSPDRSSNLRGCCQWTSLLLADSG